MKKRFCDKCKKEIIKEDGFIFNVFPISYGDSLEESFDLCHECKAELLTWRNYGKETAQRSLSRFSY